MVEGYRVGPDYIEAHRVFVAADDTTDRVLGFYALVLDPPELDLMFVADEAQGRGIGRLLAAHLREEARAAGLAGVRIVSRRPPRASTGASAPNPSARSGPIRPPCAGPAELLLRVGEPAPRARPRVATGPSPYRRSVPKAVQPPYGRVISSSQWPLGSGKYTPLPPSLRLISPGSVRCGSA
ncbi:hypothetical protein SCALM49S_05154 [Streptomyces californicus]